MSENRNDESPPIEKEFGGKPAQPDQIKVTSTDASTFRAVGCDEDAARLRFKELARQWKEETLFLSSITDKATNPAYQQIIGMGKEALPLLLDELRQKPDHWFWALQAITGQNRVPASLRGNMAQMAQAWLEWGERQGL